MSLTYDDITILISRYYQKLNSTRLDFIRYLYNRINWDARIIGIKGARGVGKSTLLMQRIKLFHKNPEDAIYVSLDNMWFSSHTLESLVEFLYSRGIRYFYLDEVHRYPMWSRVIKNLYDFYADINIVYTGSALLAIDHAVADLSRRQSLYSLWGMSFREYLEYENIISLPAVSLPSLLDGHVSLALQLTATIPILRHFESYLEHGYYPFYKENPEDFSMRLEEVIKIVIENDIPETEEISLSTVSKLKTLMMVIAENAPFEPNISKLAERLECSRELCVKMLNLLDRARLLQQMFKHPRTYKQMRGADKVLGGDTNILHALTGKVNIGTSRETFFVNQMRAVGEVVIADHGDYIIDGKYTFEIGGSGKKFSQIADIPDSYLAVDDITTGYGSRIPLYLFGMLY